MLSQEKVFSVLEGHGITFYVGVPDSYLNAFCNYALTERKERTVIAANEGNAVAIAAGHYFASKEIPLVFMQNSGMGNAINPLASLADQNVYAVPMLLMIGWRGQGDTEPHHPQHKLQGEITPKLLELLHIPYSILEDDETAFEKAIGKAVETCRGERKSYALLVPRGIMAEKEKKNLTDELYPMSREEAMEVILDHLPKDAICVATTGRATRELFFLREKRGEPKTNDFLNVGAMGHVSSVALGIAKEKKEREVVVFDGDGAAIMHLGAMTMAAKENVPNLLHVILNNGAHESVGGQPTAGYEIDLTGIAHACHYETVGKPVTTKEELISALEQLKDRKRAGFIDCRVHKGLSRKLPPIVFDHREAIDGLIRNLSES